VSRRCWFSISNGHRKRVGVARTHNNSNTVGNENNQRITRSAFTFNLLLFFVFKNIFSSR
jgi:hypothetical protein